jgi:kanamycin kinase
MTIPAEPIEPPERVRDLARGAALVPVWRNNYGGLTFRTDDGRYIKHGPRNLEWSFADESVRLEWAGRFIHVPHVLDAGADDTHEWLVTRAIPGESAVSPRWVAQPDIAVRAVGEGLRALHEALPMPDCPFDWGVPSRIANAERRGIRVPDALREPPQSTGSSCATPTPAARTPSSATTAGGSLTSISGCSEPGTAGPTSPWHR